MGSTLRLARGASVGIEATARINPDIDALDRLELVIDGDVARTEAPRDDAASSAIALRHELKAENGFWLAVRAYGKNHAVSHSAPVYVQVGETGSWSAAKAPALVMKMRARLKALAETPILAWRELEFWELGDDFAALWKRQKPRLAERIAQANLKYDELLFRINGGRKVGSGGACCRTPGGQP